MNKPLTICTQTQMSARQQQHTKLIHHTRSAQLVDLWGVINEISMVRVRESGCIINLTVSTTFLVNTCCRLFFKTLSIDSRYLALYYHDWASDITCFICCSKSQLFRWFMFSLMRSISKSLLLSPFSTIERKPVVCLRRRSLIPFSMFSSSGNSTKWFDHCKETSINCETYSEKVVLN